MSNVFLEGPIKEYIRKAVLESVSTVVPRLQWNAVVDFCKPLDTIEDAENIPGILVYLEMDLNKLRILPGTSITVESFCFGYCQGVDTYVALVIVKPPIFDGDSLFCRVLVSAVTPATTDGCQLPNPNDVPDDLPAVIIEPVLLDAIQRRDNKTLAGIAEDAMQLGWKTVQIAGKQLILIK